ncbi:MAG: hypothetical protein ACYDAY_03305 [Candidatus Dormibacteria bacterium]
MASFADRLGGRTLDEYLESARAEIEVRAANADLAADPAERRVLLDEARVLAYNLAADLADCWPDDGQRRGTRHFQAGLEAGLECLRWTEELERGARARSTGHWVVGMHQLSLGQVPDAAASWKASLALAGEAASGSLRPEQDFLVALTTGYLAIARMRLSDAGAEGELDRARSTFRSLADGAAEDAGAAAEASLGLEQLDIVRERYSPIREWSR